MLEQGRVDNGSQVCAEFLHNYHELLQRVRDNPIGLQTDSRLLDHRRDTRAEIYVFSPVVTTPPRSLRLGEKILAGRASFHRALLRAP